VYRICRELELNIRIKPRRRIERDKPQALSVPLSINQTWSIDFMSDSLNTGKKIRIFNVIDNYNREYLGIDVDNSLPAQRVIQSLDRMIEWHGKTKAIRCDNSSRIYISCTQRMGTSNGYWVQPGKPIQNAYIERFNRNEWLTCIFLTLSSMLKIWPLSGCGYIITNDLIVRLVWLQLAIKHCIKYKKNMVNGRVWKYFISNFSM